MLRRRRCTSAKHLLAEHTVDIKEARASQAIFVDPDLSLVRVAMTTSAGDPLVLMMSMRTAAAMIQTMHSAYIAANPPLRFGQGEATRQGM